MNLSPSPTPSSHPPPSISSLLELSRSSILAFQSVSSSVPPELTQVMHDLTNILSIMHNTLSLLNTDMAASATLATNAMSYVSVASQNLAPPLSTLSSSPSATRAPFPPPGPLSSMSHQPAPPPVLSAAEQERLRSLVVSGLPESPQTDSVARAQDDASTVARLLTFLGVECEASSVYRLGSPKDGTARLVKVVLPASRSSLVHVSPACSPSCSLGG